MPRRPQALPSVGASDAGGRFRRWLEVVMDCRLDFRKKTIISRLFDFDRRLTDFLFEPKDAPELRERPAILLEESWEFSPKERVLVRAGLDLWSGSGEAFLAELIGGLDDSALHRLVSALEETRKLKWSAHGSA